ncbi:MAG TPA: hypothetical protein VHC22_24075 [Pirellulales bacterium]|nr:hypothetical protein [Pirellulales bacterium]
MAKNRTWLLLAAGTVVLTTAFAAKLFARKQAADVTTMEAEELEKVRSSVVEVKTALARQQAEVRAFVRLFGHGIVNGFEVSVDPGTPNLKVSSGLALDASGRVIAVSEDQVLRNVPAGSSFLLLDQPESAAQAELLIADSLPKGALCLARLVGGENPALAAPTIDPTFRTEIQVPNVPLTPTAAVALPKSK